MQIFTPAQYEELVDEGSVLAGAVIHDSRGLEYVAINEYNQHRLIAHLLRAQDGQIVHCSAMLYPVGAPDS